MRALLERGVEPAAALVFALWGGHEATARLLLEAGADPNRPEEMSVPGSRGVCAREAHTPLMAAAVGCPTLITLLLDRGADRGAIPAAARCAGRSARLDALDTLAGASEEPRSILRWGALGAAEAGQVETVRALLDRVALDGPEGSLLAAAMQAAVAEPDDEARRELVGELAARGPDFGARAPETTLVHLAAALGDATILRRALEAGGSVAEEDGSGCVPLAVTTSLGDPAVVELLLAAGADPDARTAEGAPILVALSLHGSSVEHVRHLCSGGADPDARGPRGAALHKAAWRSEHCRKEELAGRLAILKLLLERGADVFARDDRGRTPLSIAHETGFTEAAALLQAASPPLSEDPREALAQLGFDFDRRGLLRAASAPAVTDALERFVAAGFELSSDAGYDALVEAIAREHLDVARYLVEHGAPLRSARPNPLCAAAATRSGPLVGALLGWGADPDAPGSDGEGPLVHAVRAMAPAVVARLLDAGADPNAGDGAALFELSRGVRHAMEDGDFDVDVLGEVVARLASAGADLEVARRGDTPLVAAVRASSLPVVRALLRAGADPEPARRHAVGAAMRRALTR